MKIYLVLLLLFTSCLERSDPSEVIYSTPEMREELRKEKREQKEKLNAERLRKEEEERKKKQAAFELAKINEWKRINSTAKETYKDIARIISKKCADCHDEHRRLPLYGRIFRRINPVYKHQKHGLAAIDFSQIFPLKTSDGYSSKLASQEVNINAQISFLKAIKDSVVKRTMPLRSYTFIYRYRKIFKSDELAIVSWVDPIIEDLVNYQQKFEGSHDDGSLTFKTKNIFESKCIRCHGNGNNRGRFGDIENFEKLIKSKYINIANPEESILYKEVLSGSMPTNRSERLNEEELSYVLEWIKEIKSDS